MPYKENLELATKQKKELDGLRPLSSEAEIRIMQKFRLDWNYHSSHIEGNQLTYGETKALILFGHTAQAKPLKDHLEMSGHDEAIKNIEDVIKQKRPLNENFIRELHILILKEPYKVDAITPDGKPTRRTVQVGKYKSVPNHVKTKTGEIFYFSTPEETPAKMTDLMQWYANNKDNSDIHPVLFATEFHYRFIRIHPFDDGNGRIARLIMNFILMQYGYPPAIIKTEDKLNYFAALEQADAGELEYFFNYVCQQVNRSLVLMIKGAKGESIEEDNDLDKKLILLKQEVEAEDKENEITKLTTSVIQDAYKKWIHKFLYKIAETTVKFNDFYNDPSHTIIADIDNNRSVINFKKKINFKEIVEYVTNLEKNKNIDSSRFVLNTRYGAYKKGGLNPFGCNYSIEIKFELYNFELLIGYFDSKSEKQSIKSYPKRLFHNPLSIDELEDINKNWGDTLFQHLEYHRKLMNNKHID